MVTCPSLSFGCPTTEKPSPYFEATPESMLSHSLFGLDDAQLAFRRSKLDELGAPRLKKEYPSTPLEASQTSIGFVKTSTIRRRRRSRYLLTSFMYARRKSRGANLWSVERMRLPNQNENYTIGVDTVEGSHGDYSCAQVLD